MPRFSSLEYAPIETRRLLRERLQRQLGREPGFQAPEPDRPALDDEAMLRLLQNLNIGFGNEWARVLRTYQAALSSDVSEPSIEDRLAAGWGRVVWGRIKAPLNLSLAIRRAGAKVGAIARVLEECFVEDCRLVPHASLEGELLLIAERVERGEMALRHLSCRSPTWVAARLWDRTQQPADNIRALRIWVDRWKVLSTPELAPSKAWDSLTADRFRRAALQVLETEPALEDWEETHARFIRELAVEQGREQQDVSDFIPDPPQTLVDRALWLEDNRVEMRAQESLDVCSDLLGLVGLLLEDVEAQPFSGAPHPIAARLFELACSRPDVFFQLILLVRWRPRLLADLLLHPPTSALACLIIGRWRPGASAFDPELVRHSDGHGNAAAFEDAVSILAWWLEKGSVAPAEVAALLVWLHRSAGNGFIDDLAEQERLRMVLRNALLLLCTDTLQAMFDTLAEKCGTLKRVGARFAAALELVAVGDLTNRISPAPLVNAYADALANDDISLSVQRIGVEGAAALFALAQRAPELLERFIHPIDVCARLAQGDEPDANPYTVADALARSLRAHVRVLCRAVAGRAEPAPEDLAAALVSAVRSGALSHKEKGRVAAFAPRHEVNTLGVRRDRPIASDLAAALGALSGDHRGQLLSVILETDEPMVLAQILPLAPRETRAAIEQRLEALPPANAGTTYSLIEVQARIDELLSAGALGAAAKFIEEEGRLQTLGKVQGREVARLRSEMRLRFARRAWNEIMATQSPPDLGSVDRDAADEVVQFYKGLTLLVRPDGRDPGAAELIFQDLRRRRPNVAAYAVNVIAAQIGTLLPVDVFGRLDGAAARRARQILVESDVLANDATSLSRTDRKTLACNQAILRLALGEPDQVLALLPSTVSTRLDERTQAYRAVALSRLGRPREAVSVLKATEDNLGKTEFLEAAWAHIREGEPFAGSVDVSSNDDPVARIREAYRDLQLLDPVQQAAVVNLDNDPLTAFVIEQVRGAAASVVALVTTMEVVKIDGCEDDVTAVVRELLLSRLDYLRWSAPDQSKGGFTPKGNPGERDLMIVRGSTILTVIEAVICRKPIHRQMVQENLKRHFQKLLAYGTCRLFFHLTYVYDQDVQGVIELLKTMAASAAPKGYDYAGLTEIALTDSRPNGFVACYGDGQGELKVVFLALNMGQQRQRTAAIASKI